MLFTMSMRMCSLSRNVQDAQSRKTTLNSTHCSSSQAFDDMSNALRTIALIAETTTASRIAHAHQRPICTLTASIALLRLSSARTQFPLPRHPQKRSKSPVGGRLRNGLQLARLSTPCRHTAPKVKPPCAGKPRLLLTYFFERAKGIEPSTYSLGSCRSTTELRPQIRPTRKDLGFGSSKPRPRGLSETSVGLKSGGHDGIKFRPNDTTAFSAGKRSKSSAPGGQPDI